jgi:hypothetical protein
MLPVALMMLAALTVALRKLIALTVGLLMRM